MWWSENILAKVKEANMEWRMGDTVTIGLQLISLTSLRDSTASFLMWTNLVVGTHVTWVVDSVNVNVLGTLLLGVWR